jgi:ABC-type antimicrobial peptide transport system permease subunit
VPVAELLSALREAIRSVDPELPVIEMTTLDTLLSRTVARPRFYALLLGGFAVFSLLLSMAGLHGLLAALVTSRRREIGIRMAIGADRRRVRRWVTRQVLTLSASGLAVGLALSLALRPLLEGLLFQVEGGDLPSLALVLALTLLGSAITAYPHVRRAAGVDPAEVMRS